MVTHEFGIIEEWDENTRYNEYAPEKYGCVEVEDEVVSGWMDALSMMKTYFHGVHRPEVCLAYSGITLIPLESLVLLEDVAITNGGPPELIALIRHAVANGNHMIHFGI